jgi:hypothetical protein
MSSHTLREQLFVYPAILPASTALTGVYSSAIDTRGYNSALVIVNCGLAAASAELDVMVWEGAARTVTTTHTHVTGSSFTQMAPAPDQTVYVGEVDLTKTERYISIRMVRDGTNDVTAGCVVVLGNQSFGAPVTQYNTLAFAI